MTETIVLPPPALRLCQIEEVLDANFIELLRLAPANLLVRAWLLKLCGKQPPAEILTFDSVKDWIEFNCLKRFRASATARSLPADGISIDVDFEETEYGRCDYSVNCSANEPFRLPAEELLEIIQDTIDDGGGLNRVVDNIADKIDDEAWERCEPSLDASGEYHYNDHESQSSEDGSVTFERSQIRRLVEQFLQQQHPDLFSQL